MFVLMDWVAGGGIDSFLVSLIGGGEKVGAAGGRMDQDLSAS